MYYITAMQHRRPKQITIEDILFGEEDPYNAYENETESSSTATVTKSFPTISDEIRSKVNVDAIIGWLKRFNESNADLFETNRKDLYTSWMIPKATGGFRQIDAPCPKLQNQLQRLAIFLKEDCGVLYHTSAFAYINGRSIVDNVQKHVGSNWFLKTDFSGFFPSTTLDFTMKMMKIIFPLSEVCRTETGFNELKKALSLGFLNGGLPQGTCLSPVLTNMIMIPIDHKLFNTLTKRAIVYTRYADDIHISAREMFPYQKVVAFIEETLKEFEASYVIKPEKTHYGNLNGKNWMLGLMLTRDHKITVVYK